MDETRPSPFFALFRFRVFILNANRRTKNGGGLETRLDRERRNAYGKLKRKLGRQKRGKKRKKPKRQRKKLSKQKINLGKQQKVQKGKDWYETKSQT